MADLRGPGGTPGGLGQFLAGLAMAVAGGFMLTSRVSVTTGFWQFWGYSAFGLTLVPFIFGIVILFFNGRSVLGWLLLFTGVVLILAGIILNLQIYFQHTSLFELIVMLVLLFGGIGLLARSLRSHA
ncbi:MAG TPA: hypothetical protein VF756_15350 [Thermoanaerobaculia bacterium]